MAKTWSSVDKQGAAVHDYLITEESRAAIMVDKAARGNTRVVVVKYNENLWLKHTKNKLYI